MKMLVVSLVFWLMIPNFLHSVEKLRFAHVYEPHEPFHQWALWAAEEIKTRSQGQFLITVFPASSLGKESEINESLSIGTIDLIYTGWGFLGLTYKPISIGGAPYIFRDFEHWKKYIKSDLYIKTLGNGYTQKSGHTILATIYYGARHVTSNKPIYRPEDMRGMKIRVPNAPMFAMFPKAVGANPTPIAFSEAYLALMSGAVEAQENPLPTIKSKKFYEIQKYINLTGHIINDLVLVASGHLWKRLSAEHKALFKEVFDRAAESASNDILYREKILIEWFEEQGVIVNDRVDVNAMRKITERLHNQDTGWSLEIYHRLQALK